MVNNILTNSIYLFISTITSPAKYMNLNDSRFPHKLFDRIHIMSQGPKIECPEEMTS